jgi:hypothetical protein
MIKIDKILQDGQNFPENPAKILLILSTNTVR